MPLLQKSSVPIMSGGIDGAPIMDGSICAMPSQLSQRKLSGVLFEAQTTAQVDCITVFF